MDMFMYWISGATRRLKGRALLRLKRMATCVFAVDKQKSYEILQQIAATDKDQHGLLPNKLKLIELMLIDNPSPNERSNIKDYYDQVISESLKGEEQGYDSKGFDIDNIYGDEAQIIIREITYGSRLYFFIYDEQLQSWIVSNMARAMNGIDFEGCVTMLDFREYLKESE